MLAASLVVTPEGRRGVVYSAAGGVQEQERPEGFSFIFPFAQSAIQMDVRTQKFFTDEAFAQSADLQEVTVHVAVNYRVDPTKAAEVFQEVGRGYEDILIRPAVLQLVKQEVGLVSAIDFATQREALAADIEVELVQRLEPAGIIVEFVAIEDAIFDPDFIAAVKAKIIADEKAAESARLVTVATNEAEQVRQRAAGDADAIRITAEAQAEANLEVARTLTTDLLVWQRILQWDGVLPQTLLGSEADVLLEVR